MSSAGPFLRHRIGIYLGGDPWPIFYAIEMVYTLIRDAGPFLHHRTGTSLLPRSGMLAYFLRHRNGIYLDGDP